MTGSDSPLAANLAEDLGVPVEVDTDAYVAPTSFTQEEQKKEDDSTGGDNKVLLVVLW